jgi:hypothetical protein
MTVSAAGGRTGRAPVGAPRGVPWWAVASSGAGQAGLAERVMGGIQALWPLLVVLSCRWRQSLDQTPAAGHWDGDMHHEAVYDGGLDRQLCGCRS